MLDALFRDRVTVRRAIRRGVKNDVDYEEVLDQEDGKAGGPIPIVGRLERRRRRILISQGEEVATDATFIYREVAVPEISVNDLLVDDKDQAYRVETLEKDESIFGAGKFVRAELRLTRLPVPKDKDSGRPNG